MVTPLSKCKVFSGRPQGMRTVVGRPLLNGPCPPKKMIFFQTPFFGSAGEKGPPSPVFGFQSAGASKGPPNPPGPRRLPPPLRRCPSAGAPGGPPPPPP